MRKLIAKCIMLILCCNLNDINHISIYKHHALLVCLCCNWLLPVRIICAVSSCLSMTCGQLPNRSGLSQARVYNDRSAFAASWVQSRWSNIFSVFHYVSFCGLFTQLGTQTAVSDLVSSSIRRFRAAASSSPWMRWTNLSGSCFCLILGPGSSKKNIWPKLPIHGINKSGIPGHVPSGSWSMHICQIL